MISLFVDSNFFIALYNPQDSLFNKAQNVSQKIAKENMIVTFSNLIFLETVTIISQRVGKQPALAAGKRLLNDPSFRYVHIDAGIQEISWTIFQEIKNKDMSFVDCSIIACLQFEGIKSLLTFDGEFKTFEKRYKFKLYE